ncbi:MAG: radical SAM protein [Candidatus Bathyarchaeia archaeon]
MRIALVNSPYPSGAPTSLYIPMGISYLTAYLESEGFDVDVFDFQASPFNEGDFISRLQETKPGIIGISSTTLSYNPALQLAKIAKKACPNSLVIMGGPHVTVLDREALMECPELDIVVRGEGEQTLLEIAQLKTSSRISELNEVLGITFKKNGEIIRTADRPFIQNLDALPFPAFDHLPLERYRLFGKTYLPIITSRGCPFQCTFCLASKMSGRKFRAQSPGKVIQDLQTLRDKYGAEAITFYDDTFTFDMERAERICEEIKRRDFRVPWDCRTRVDRVSKKLLATMRSANCQLMHFGVESGSQEILNAMKKGVTVEQNLRAIKWAKEADILVAISVIIGYPGENERTVQETIEFIRKAEPDYVYVCIPTPYPGTELYDIIKSLGWKMSTDWSNYDEQTPLFINPNLPPERIREIRREFYNKYLSPIYILRKSLRNDFYSRVMARVAINDFLWRLKIPRILGNVKKLLHS